MSIAWSTIKNAIAALVVAGSSLESSKVLWAGTNAPRPATAPYISMRLSGLRNMGRDSLESEDNPLDLPDATITAVNTTTNDLTVTAHQFQDGDGPCPIGVTGGTWAEMVGYDWWIIVRDANTVSLAASFADAMNDVEYDIQTAGTGTRVIQCTADTLRQGEEITTSSRGHRELTLTLQCFAATSQDSSDPVAVLNSIVSAANLESRRAALHAAGIGLSSFGPIRSFDGVIGMTVFEPRAVVEVRLNLAEEVEEDTTIIQFVEVENLSTSTTVFVPEDPNP